MAEHTELPWEVHPRDASAIVVANRGGTSFRIMVAECVERSPDPDRDIGPDAARANAAFIVRAANYHEQYEQALRDIEGHGVTMPMTTEQNMTEGERRWYARGVDSQRSIAIAALAAERVTP